MKEMWWVQYLCLEDPLEEEIATHSSILASEIPWTEEPGRSKGSQSQTQLIVRARATVVTDAATWSALRQDNIHSSRVKAPVLTAQFSVLQP